MEKYCCIWTWNTESWHFNLDKFHDCFCGLVRDELFSTLQPLSHRHHVTRLSLFYHYLHTTCSEERHSLVQLFQVFTKSTPYGMTTELNHHYFHHIPFIRGEFPSNSFSPRTANLWNRLLGGYFSEHNNVNLFKSKVNQYLSSFSSYFSLLSTSSYIRITYLTE